MKLTFNQHKLLWAALIGGYFTAGYLVVNWLNGFRPCYFNIGLPFESKIPFISFFITGYTLVYLGILGLLVIIKDEVLFKKAVKAFFILTTLHLFIFILFPVKMYLRPEMSQQTNFFDYLTKFYYSIDMPHNCFPSLHVAYPFLGTLVLWNYKRNWAYIYIVATVLISISVILVKQHYILDVVGGYVTSFLVYAIALKSGVVSKEKNRYPL